MKKKPELLLGKGKAREEQASEPFLEVLHPRNKHHSILPLRLKHQGPIGTAYQQPKIYIFSNK